MRFAPAPVTPREPLTTEDGSTDAGASPRHHRVRPLDDGTTEQVQVIEFVLRAGDSIQPVLWLERRLLD